MSIRITIVEDDAVLRKSLATLVRTADGLACAGSHPSAEEALSALARERPDVVLLDLELPGLSGLDCIPQIKRLAPRAEILILTVSSDAHRIFKALESGASGYLVKPAPSEKIVEAIADVHNGGAPMSPSIARLVIQRFQSLARTKAELATLTPREEEILVLLAKGLWTKDIADRLNIGVRTIETHCRHIYDKLHVCSRTQAIIKFMNP